MGGKSSSRRRVEDLSKESLLYYIRNQADRAAGLRHILDDFQADKTDRKQIKEILDQLVKDEKLVRHKGNRYEAPPEMTLYRGRIALHPDGYGFVTPEESIPGITGDVFIPPPKTNTAMDGDLVAIAVITKRNVEGSVIRVEERARNTIVGQLLYDGRVYFVAPADRRLPAKVLVKGDVSEHKDKIVEVELTRYPSEQHWPAGDIVSVIGFLDDDNIETTVIIKKYGLSVEFPDAVEEEAGRIPTELAETDMEGRADFRERATITIDPVTARDFDDAVDVEELPDGSFRLGVHIADVAHFVRPGSAVDREARERGCSVYFPDRVVPMLPERLSNDICSLNPGVDRFAMSAVLDVDPDGRIRDASFANSVIRSRERFTYDTIQGILDGDSSLRKRHHKTVGTIGTLAKLAELLRQQRIQRGTIDFDLPEPELTYDEQGAMTGVVKTIRHFSHRMIEEFMIAANEAVARLLETKIRATIFRVHERPDAERVGELSDTLAEMGLRFRPRKLTSAAFQRFLESIEGRPDAQMVSFLVLRSFRQAVYSAQNRGHFGLASTSYTYFTSPIRRYPDLIIHRLLKAYLARQRHTGYTVPELETIAASASSRERIAEQAERDLLEWKRMILLEDHLGDTMDAIVIGVHPKGMRIELVDYFIEGQVSVDDLDDDYYELNSRARTLVGRGTRRTYRLGQRVRVRVARVDKLLGRAYFIPVVA